MFSLTTEYALRAAIDLAGHPGDARSARAIALQAEIPGAYVSRVLAMLARNGLVRAQRGRSGGYDLARPPADITLFDIVEAISPISRFPPGDLLAAEAGPNLGNLRHALDGISAAAIDQLKAVTLADLVG